MTARPKRPGLRLGRVLGVVLLGFVLLTVASWASLRRGDIPWERLDAKYASADSRWVDLPGGVRMHYRDQGRRDGPVLLLVHGFAASLHTWEPWVADLGRDHRVISVDLPGFGLTRTPEGFRIGPDTYTTALEQFARARGLDRFTLIGNSMGGAAAWQYALVHPERLDALVLVDAAGWRTPMEERSRDGPAIFRILANPIGATLLRDLDTSALTAQGLRAVFVNDLLVTPAMVRRYVELSRAPGRRAQIVAMMTGPRAAYATPERLAAIRTPTLVMTGEQDVLIPAAHARRFAQAIPDATLVAYPLVGHVPQEEIPARSAADVREFLSAARTR